MSESNSTNPLENPEIDNMSVAELFASDPRELTKEQRRKIVNALRERRKIFSAAKTKAKASGKRTKKSDGVTLQDLGAKAAAMDSVANLLSKIEPGKKK